MPLQATLLERPSGGLEVDEGVSLFDQIDDPAEADVEQLTGLWIREVELEELFDRDRLGAIHRLDVELEHRPALLGESVLGLSLGEDDRLQVLRIPVG